MVQSGHARASALSPLGTVSLEITGSSAVVIDVDTVGVPPLPKGMSCDGVLLFSLRLDLPVTRQAPIHIRASADHNGDPEIGQWLDSMAFKGAAGVVQLAMRDDEWLATKGVFAEPVKYDKQGFTQTINEAPAGIKIYASAAWRNAPLPVDDASAWFAADLALP